MVVESEMEARFPPDGEKLWGHSIFSKVRHGKSISEIGHVRNETVLKMGGYFVRKQSADPKMTEVTGILSIDFHGHECLFNRKIMGKMNCFPSLTAINTAFRAWSAVTFPCTGWLIVFYLKREGRRRNGGERKLQQQAAQKGKKEEAGHILLSPATNYPAAQWQQKAERRRRRRRSAGPGGAAGCCKQKAFLSWNAVCRGGSSALALLCAPLGLVSADRHLPGKGCPAVWESFCSLQLAALCPAIAGQCFAGRLMLQL